MPRQRVPLSIQYKQKALEAQSTSGDKVEKEEISKSPDEIKISYELVKKAVVKYLARNNKVAWRLSRDVLPYQHAPQKRVLCYQVVKVVTPYEFHLRLAVDKDCYGYQQLFKEMQTFYNNQNNSDVIMIQNFMEVVAGMCFVCKSPEDGHWYRVRIHHVWRLRELATVYYCDLGKLCDVPFTNLREILPTFAKLSAQVFVCYLYDVLPIRNNATGIHWSDKAIEFFRKLVLGKKVYGICLARSDTRVNKRFPDVITYLGMVLRDFDRQPFQCTINAQMVDEGFAEPIGVFGGCIHSFEEPESPPRFETNKFRRTYRFPPAPPVTPAPFPLVLSEDEQKLLMRVQTSDVVKPEVTWKTHLEQLPKLNIDSRGSTPIVSGGKLPAIFSESMAQFTICFVMGPNCMIIHFRSRLAPMMEMQEALKSLVQYEEPITPPEAFAGEFVACKIIDNRNAESKGIWCRGILLKGLSNGNYNIFLVDYGHDVYVKESYCRRLPAYFQNIPSFAVRCHLDLDNLVPRGQLGWNTDTCLFFRRYMLSWQDHEPVYFMYRSRSHWIELVDFKQDVTFDFSAKKWVAGTDKKLKAHQPINAKRDHVLLRSLYRSYGVDMAYEVLIEKSPFWYFESLAESFIENNYAGYDKKTRCKAAIHRDIVRLHDYKEADEVQEYRDSFRVDEIKVPPSPYPPVRSLPENPNAQRVPNRGEDARRPVKATDSRLSATKDSFKKASTYNLPNANASHEPKMDEAWKNSIDSSSTDRSKSRARSMGRGLSDPNRYLIRQSSRSSYSDGDSIRE